MAEIVLIHAEPVTTSEPPNKFVKSELSEVIVADNNSPHVSSHIMHQNTQYDDNGDPGGGSANDAAAQQILQEDNDDGVELDLSQIADLSTLFDELADLLAFDHPKVRSDCCQMISRILPQLAPSELDPCVASVLPELVRNLGHPVEEVRIAAAGCLQLHLRLSEDTELTMKALVDSGLRHDDPTFRRMIAANLSRIFADDLSSHDWRLPLCRLILMVVRHDAAEPEAVQALQQLRGFVGDDRFQLYLREMEGAERLEVGRFLAGQRRRSLSDSSRTASRPTPEMSVGPDADLDFVDPTVLEMLRDEHDWQSRVQGIEQLRYTVRHLSNVNALLARMTPFLSFLDRLLRDSNFKVTLVTLDIYSVVIERLAWRVRPHLDRIVGSLVRHLGENRIAVRAQTTRVLTALMHGTGPATVVDALCHHLLERTRAQVREEILNLITVALLTFPSYEFRLRDVCGAVAPSLLDQRRRLRQAALECLATITQAMGPSKLSAVASAVDEAAATGPGEHDVEGALAAVLARLARRQLPRVAADGTVEYSLRVPSSRDSCGGRSSRLSSNGIVSSFPQGADIDWILSGSGSLGSGSAQSRGGCTPTPPPPLPVSGPASFPGSPSVSRRIVSPGQGKNWLPWSEMGGLVPGCNSGGSLPDPHRSPSRAEWNPPASPSRVMRPNTRAFEELAVSQTGGASWTEPPDEIPVGYHNAVITNGYHRHPSNQHHANGGLNSHQHSGTSSYGKSHPGRPPTTERTGRPLEKVAAMLGNNILPSKLRPDNDVGGHRDRSGRSPGGGGTTVIPLTTIIPYTPSNTWPGSGAGTVTLPSLPQRRKVLGPIPDARDAPVPTRPTLARCNSGGKRSRVPPIGQTQVYGNGRGGVTDDSGDDVRESAASKPSRRSEPRERAKPPLSQTDSGLESSLHASTVMDSPSENDHHQHRRSLQNQANGNGRQESTTTSKSSVSVAAPPPPPPVTKTAIATRGIKNGDSRNQHEIRSDEEEGLDDIDGVGIPEDSRKKPEEYSHARNSVDSGVASRPRSRASSNAAAAARPRRPVSLNLDTLPTSTAPPPDGATDLLTSPSEDDDDDDDEDWCTEDEGIRNRAISRVSSYSSLENFHDEGDSSIPGPSRPPPVHRSSSFRLEALDNNDDNVNDDELDGTFGRIGRTNGVEVVPENPVEGAATSVTVAAKEDSDDEGDRDEADLLAGTVVSSPRRVRRKHSSLSWDLNPPTPIALRRHRLRRTSSLSLGATTEEESRLATKLADHLGGPLSAGKPQLKAEVVNEHPPAPLHGRTADGQHQSVMSPSQPPLTSSVEGTTVDHSMTNGYLIAPRVRSNDQVFVSCSPDVTPPGRRDINVVGKGMLPHNDANIYATVNLMPPSAPMPDNSAPQAPGSPTLPTVQGRSLQHDSIDGNLSNEEEDPYSMSLSRNTFNKMMSRKMEMMKEAERRKYERQQRLQEQRRSWLQEQDQTKKGEQDDRLSIRNGQVGLTAKSPSGSKPPAAKRRVRNGTLNSSTNGVSPSAKTTTSNHSRQSESEERLMRNPEDAIRTALKNIDSDEWNIKCEGIKILTNLCNRSPASLSNDIHNINLALLPEVRNLRSTVSRAAIQCYAELFSSTKKNMEADLELICKTLLHKSGESNVFIKEDVEKSLTHMVETMVPQKMALALILGGANHRNAAVRKTTAQFLAGVCEKIGPNKILSGTKDVTDRILPTAAQFVMDGSPLTRFYGRKIIFMLLGHPDFDKIIRQYIPQNTLRNIQEILEGLKTKGLGTIPNESSASSRHLKGSK